MADIFNSSSDESLSDEDEPIPKRPKIFRERINYLMPIPEKRFRLPDVVISDLLIKIERYLNPKSYANHALSGRERLLLALRFFSTGSFYRLVGDAHGPSESTVCRMVYKVAKVINSVLKKRTIGWPPNDADRNVIANRFYKFANFPLVCGCLDGTLIQIKAPRENEAQFVDRHGNHSINAMVVCGPRLEFYYVYCNWPGAVNDARVLTNSNLHMKFENGWRPFLNAVLLGDSIYPVKNWLLPPISTPNPSAAEESFNKAHKKTRVKIECAIGVAKNRFPCLRYLRVEPKVACEIINACFVLHNLCLSVAPPTEEELAEVVPNQDLDDLAADNVDLPANRIRLMQILKTFTAE